MLESAVCVQIKSQLFLPLLKEDDAFIFLLLCACCHQPLVSWDQRSLHSSYIYFVRPWNPAKSFYGFDSYSLPPRQRHKRGREHFSFTFIQEGAAARRRQQERCFPSFYSFPTRRNSRENVVNVLLHPHGFWGCSRCFLLSVYLESWQNHS